MPQIPVAGPSHKCACSNDNDIPVSEKQRVLVMELCNLQVKQVRLMMLITVTMQAILKLLVEGEESNEDF